MGRNKQRHRDRTLRDGDGGGQRRHELRPKTTAEGLPPARLLETSHTPQLCRAGPEGPPERGQGVPLLREWGRHLPRAVPQLCQTPGLCPEMGQDGLNHSYCPRHLE